MRHDVWGRSTRALLALVLGISTGSVALVATGSVAHAEPSPIALSFGSRYFTAGDGTTDQALGDVDGDGDLDLAASNNITNSVAVMLNDGFGGFGPGTEHPVGNFPILVRLADLDDDGASDIIAGRSGAVSVRLSNGDGTFAAATSYPTGSTRGMRVVDLDGDGALDVVVGVTGGGVQVFYGNGDGSLDEAVYIVETDALVEALDVADMDADGILDVVYVDRDVNRITVLLGDGAGAYTSPGSGPPSSNSTAEVAVGDVNGDEVPDVVYTFGFELRTALGTGGGSFAAPMTSRAYDSAVSAVSLADMNDDAHLDIVMNGPSFLSIYPGRGDGTWASAAEIRNGSGDPIVGDVNGDEILDVVSRFNGASGGLDSLLVSVNLSRLALPSPPVAVAADGAASVSWSPPTVAPGNVTGYVVAAFVGLSSAKSVVVDASATSATVSGLTNGTTYRMIVWPVSTYGLGSAGVSNAVLWPGPAGPPTAVAATAGNAKVRLSWTAPTNRGGLPITGYVVTPYENGVAQAPVTFTTASTVQALTGLTNGSSYRFTVATINSAGTGVASVASNAVVPATVPGAPTFVSVRAGAAKARLEWAKPTSTGGRPITGYVVTPYKNGVAQAPVTFTTASTVQAITGLTNGASYRFRVAAVNSVGTGPNSALSATIVPTA